ncbi:MAG: hypothetical protein NVS1B13_20550 [Flavisolibacter sp.]
MELLLCAATEKEIQPTIENLNQYQRGGFNMKVLITGVGLTTAIFRLTQQVGAARPQFILQAGICGALDTTLALNQTIVIKNEIIGDEGVEENGAFQSLFDLKLRDPNQFPWKDKKLSNPGSFLPFSHLKVVDGMSINEITTRYDRIELYRAKYGVQVESMEGAALHYLSLAENISFMQLRTISNYAGERNKNKWSIEGAIAQLNFELQRTIPKISELWN